MCTRKHLRNVSGITIFFGSVIYFPIEFLIYYPYFNLPGKESECLVNSMSSYDIFWYQDKAGTKYKINYSLVDVNVNIDGRWIQGFGCGCSMASSSSAQTLIGGYYPYQYGTCPNGKQCDNMLIQPAWFCTDCSECKHFLKGEKFKCRGFLKGGNNEITDADQIPESYRLDMPTEDTTFIQVSFRDGPFYIESDYLSFQIIVLGILILLPGFYLAMLFICQNLRAIKRLLTKNRLQEVEEAANTL